MSFLSNTLLTKRCPESETMKSCRETLTFHTKQRREYINITAQVEEIIRKSGVKEGLALVKVLGD